MRTADFSYTLPPELIAQTPAPQREQSRLLVLHRHSGVIEHRSFLSLQDYLREGDVLVLNNSKVIPARLRGANVRTGGEFEILLLEQNARNDWWALLRPGKRAPVGAHIALWDNHGAPTAVQCLVIETKAEGRRRLQFSGTPDVLAELDRLGEVPLPPYIKRANASQRTRDQERYQTVYAKIPGSVAAPTAGLHFSEQFLTRLAAQRVQVCYLTLHVGLGTFAPVKAEELEAHEMHAETFEMSQETAGTISAAKREGRRVIAVGTTTLRVLETLAIRVWGLGKEAQEDRSNPALPSSAPGFPLRGTTSIFIYPPYGFKCVDALLTNFHLPCSTLLMLVSAFALPDDTRGRERILEAYSEAIQRRYRFFSYGDAMLLL